ncbi:MAG: translation initiation factor eIF-1A [Candidatus Poseidoniaceae archaeon]|jgi:translation initiation factor 1A|nr:translation initiation factor eIF-1A [Candidatus Poseidoniaceae archaeon]
MGRRREEKVDEEELARLENPEGSPGKIRVKLPNDGKSKGEFGYKGEMFALAEEILGGRRVTVLCADGETRMARIPGKMRRRQWVREGDLIIVWPWDFQDSKADVKHRYTKTQAMYLSRKKVLPEVVDMFGMNLRSDDDGDIGDDLFGPSDAPEEEAEEDDADVDDDDVDDMFGSDDVEEAVEEQPVVEEMPEPEPLDDDDDDDDDIDALFA